MCIVFRLSLWGMSLELGRVWVVKFVHGNGGKKMLLQAQNRLKEVHGGAGCFGGLFKICSHE